MCGCNPIDKLKCVELDLYQRAHFKGQVATGTLFLITVIAVGILIGLNPNFNYISANTPTWIALASFGGLNLCAFALFSCLKAIGKRHGNQKAEDERIETEKAERKEAKRVKKEQKALEAAAAASTSDVPLETKTSIEEDPIKHLEEVLVNPLLDEFKGALKAVVLANYNTMNSKKSAREREAAKKAKKEELNTAFVNCKELFSHFLQNKHIFVIELLRYFGPYKTTKSIALRRLIAAYNAGDEAKLEAVRAEYEAIVQASDFRNIAKALTDSSDEKLMRDFPNLLAEIFALPDPELKRMGVVVLNEIFAHAPLKVHGKPTRVATQLKALRDAVADPTELAKQLELFVKVVREEANIPAEKYDEWNNGLIRHMLDTTFKGIVFGFLGSVVRNVRLLKLLFKKIENSEQKKRLFVELDETFLHAESSDVIQEGKAELQAEIFRLQSEINFDRETDHKIALIALAEDDTRSYHDLENDPVLKYLFDAKDYDSRDLERISNLPKVRALGAQKQYKVRLVAVPVALSEHPFKLFKNKEGLLKAGTGALSFFDKIGLDATGAVKNLFPKIANKYLLPRILASMPKMEESEQRKFDTFFAATLALLVDPVYDGTLAETAFTPIFQGIITDKGEILAQNLEELLSRDHSEITFEDISEVWKTSVGDVAEAFNEVA